MVEEATGGGKEEEARERGDAQHDIDLPDAPDMETHDVSTHVTDPPVELNTAAAAAIPQFSQYMQQDNEPLNLSVKNNVDSDFGIIDLKSGALDLSLKK